MPEDERRERTMKKKKLSLLEGLFAFAIVLMFVWIFVGSSIFDFIVLKIVRPFIILTGLYLAIRQGLIWRSEILKKESKKQTSIVTEDENARENVM